MFHVKHERKYSIYVQYINSYGYWKEHGNNNHTLCRDSKYFYTSLRDADKVAEVVLDVFRKKPYVQTVDFVHVYEVGNDDNCASWER